jgi:predicted dehydrogenase
MNKELRVGIVGAGMMGIHHAEAIRRLPCTNIVAIADSNEKMLIETSKKINILNTYNDYRQMILENNLDVIHVCTPNYTHFEISKYAIENNLNVFCEKPLGISSLETKKLVESERCSLQMIFSSS